MFFTSQGVLEGCFSQRCFAAFIFQFE